MFEGSFSSAISSILKAPYAQKDTIMGFNTTVVVINDALDQIGADPQFGAKLAAAIREHAGSRNRVDVSAGNHCNAAHVVETHHADRTALVSVGGNLGVPQLEYRGWRHHESEQQIALLTAWAEKLGFSLVKTPEPSEA